MLTTGSVFHGENSDRDYMISHLSIADGNSVDSASAWSGNISRIAHAGLGVADLLPEDPRGLGGLVIGANIIYDMNDDGDFTPCGFGGVDEDYDVLLYIGHCGWENVGFAKAAASFSS